MAEKKQKKKRRWGGRPTAAGVTGGLAGFMGGQMAGRATQLLGQLGAASLIRDNREFTLSPAQLEQLKRSMDVSDVPVEQIDNVMRSRFQWPTKSKAMKKALERQGVTGVKKPTVFSRLDAADILAHELGHAQNYMKPGIARYLQKARVPGMIVAGLAPLAAVAGSTDDDTISGRIAKYSPLAAAAGAAPTVIEEGLASAKGYKHLKKLDHFNPAQLRAMRGRLAKAWGTYGAMGAGLAVAPFATRKIKKRVKSYLEKDE